MHLMAFQAKCIITIPSQSEDCQIPNTGELMLQAKNWRKRQFGHEHLSRWDCDQLLEALGPSSEAAAIYPLYQMHGETVEVPPGTIHAVHNWEDCAKLAVEMIRGETGWLCWKPNRQQGHRCNIHIDRHVVTISPGTSVSVYASV